MKLFGNRKSGNVYKVSLALHLLGLPYEEVQIGLGPGSEAEAPEFRALNPLGQIPVLETDQGRHIWQSNAILWFLASQTPLLPDDPWQQAMVLQWLCFEQYELEPNLAWARWICHLKNEANKRVDALCGYQQAGYKALTVVEQQLGKSRFIASGDLTIADIALFAYIHNCHQGGMSLDDYPTVSEWVRRISGIAGFFPMEAQFSGFNYA